MWRLLQNKKGRSFNLAHSVGRIYPWQDAPLQRFLSVLIRTCKNLFNKLLLKVFKEFSHLPGFNIIAKAIRKSAQALPVLSVGFRQHRMVRKSRSSG